MSFGQSPLNDPHCVVKIIRLAPDRAEQMVIISAGFEGVQTHYTHRTVICGGDECKLCFQGRPTRFLGFVVVRWRLGKGLLRLTSGPATQLMAMRPRPGLTLLVNQKNARSPYQLKKLGFTDVSPEDTMSQLELLNCLSHLFGVGSVDFNDTYEQNLARLQALAVQQCASELLPFDVA